MRIHHVALRTADLARLESFYVNVIGLAVIPAAPRAAPGGGDRVWLAAGGAVLMLEGAADGEPTVTPGTMDLLAFGAFTGEDAGGDATGRPLDRWRARLERAGVPVEAETPHTLYFRDPDGRRVALSDHPLR